jgi:hypothetical protein
LRKFTQSLYWRWGTTGTACDHATLNPPDWPVAPFTTRNFPAGLQLDGFCAFHELEAPLACVEFITAY